MKVDAGVGIKNKFTIVVEDIKTQQKKVYEAYNIVLNSMWSRLVNFQAFFAYIHFGTGNGTFDDPTRTSLYSHLGTKAATTEFQTKALPTSQWRRKIVLNPEEYVGQTITEIGVAYGAASSDLVTHAAPKDAEGNPIAIGPKTDTEIVTIYADVHFVLDENMYGGKIKWVTPLANNQLLSYLMGGNNPTYQFRTTFAHDFDIPPSTSPFNTAITSTITTTDWIKDAANKKATTPVRRLGVSNGNGELRGFALGGGNDAGIFRGHFPIPGVFTNTAVEETVGMGDGETVGFNLSWNDPQNLIIKIDGTIIDSANYSVSQPKKTTSLFRYRTPKMLAGTMSSPEYLVDGNVSPETSPSAAIGIDVGVNYSSVLVNEFRIYKLNSQNFRNFRIFGSSNGDFTNETLLGTIANLAAGWTSVIFSPVAYRYYRITVESTTSIGEIELLPADDQITFNAPPPAGAVITAEYNVDYIPKDSNHVLDLQAAIQYGEVT